MAAATSCVSSLFPRCKIIRECHTFTLFSINTQNGYGHSKSVIGNGHYFPCRTRQIIDLLLKQEYTVSTVLMAWLSFYSSLKLITFLIFFYMIDFILYNVSTCLPIYDSNYSSGGRPSLDLRCTSSRRMIRVVDMFYGHAASSAGRCRHDQQDCVTRLPYDELETPCVGFDRCRIDVPPHDVNRPIPGCRGRTTTYLHASYQCIPGNISEMYLALG